MAFAIGHVQRAWLEAMVRHGNGCRWRRGCGYLWDTWGRTERLCQSLAARGLVEKVTIDGREWWQVTAAGKKLVKK